jgi:hypothetical protein
LGFAFLVDAQSSSAIFVFFLLIVSHSLSEDDLLEAEEDREDAAFWDPVCRNLHVRFRSMNLHGLPAL